MRLVRRIGDGRSRILRMIIGHGFWMRGWLGRGFWRRLVGFGVGVWGDWVASFGVGRFGFGMVVFGDVRSGILGLHKRKARGG
jgi:hypothetical protein